MSANPLPAAQPGTAAFQSRIARLIPLWCVLLMALTAPLGALGRDLWTDEAFTLTYLQHATAGDMLADVRKNEETPPVYFLSVWAWGSAAGRGVETVRIFSLLMGLSAVALFTWAVQRWRGSTEALIAGVAMALSPQLGPYLVEARRYAFEVLLTVGVQLLYEVIRRQPRRTWPYVAYAIVSLALLMTSYFGAAIIAAHGLLTLIDLIRDPERRSERLRAWLGVLLAIGLGTIPWWPTMAYQVQRSSAVTAFWGDWPGDYFWMVLSLLLNAPARTLALIPWMLAAITGWIMIVVAVLRSRQSDDGLALRVFFAPMLMVFLMVLVLQAAATRYLLGLLPGACLTLALGYRAVQASRPRMAVPALALVLGTMLLLQGAASVAPQLTRQPSTPRTIHPWTQLVPVITAQADPARDIVLFHPPWDQRIFEYYAGPTKLPLRGAHDYDQFYYVEGHRIKTTWTTEEALAAIGDRQRVWVFYDQIFHSVPPLSLPFTQVGSWEADGLKLYLYERP